MKVKILNNPTMRNDSTGENFVLAEPMKCMVSVDGKSRFLNVPEGFSTDLASIPGCANWLVPKLGKYNRAGILHDYLYFTGQFPKGVADKIFLVAMAELGVKQWRRELMYLAVKYGGWSAWRGHRKAD